MIISIDKIICFIMITKYYIYVWSNHINAIPSVTHQKVVDILHDRVADANNVAGMYVGQSSMLI